MYHYTEERFFLCKDNHGLFLTLDKIEMPPLMQAVALHLQQHVQMLEGKLNVQTQKTLELSKSERQLRGEVNQLEQKMRETGRAIVKCQGEAVQKENTIAKLQAELRAKEISLQQADREGALKQWQENLLKKENKIAEMETKLKVIETKTTKEMQKVIVKWQEKVRVKDKQIADLKGQLKAKNAQTTLLKKELEDKKCLAMEWQNEGLKLDDVLTDLLVSDIARVKPLNVDT